MKLVDSHCHLDDAQFDGDRDATIKRALDTGMRYMLAIGTGHGPPDLEVAIRLAARHPFIYATAGVHPNDVEKIDQATFPHLRELLLHPKVKAVGEIGLDYHWGVPRELQMAAIIDQLTLASEMYMPIIVHTRDAWNDTLALLKSKWAPTALPCVMHCFTGDAAQAIECLDLGFYLAFGGVATFPKSTAIREAARITPLDRMLLETDSPYLAPVPYRGKRNEPAYLVHTAHVIAEALGLATEELAEQTTHNFEKLFSIPHQGSPCGDPLH